MGVEVLSDEWHAVVLDVAASGGSLVSPDMTFRFKIEKGPNGTQNFIWVLADGVVTTSEVAPRGYKPDMAITMKYPILLQLIAGEVSFSVGYMRGDVKFEGDAGAVLHLVPEMDRDGWAEFLSEVWAKTDPV